MGVYSVILYINYYFTNIFCLSNPQKITKRKFDTNPICCLITYFGMHKIIFVFMFYIHACAKIHVLNMCDMY